MITIVHHQLKKKWLDWLTAWVSAIIEDHKFIDVSKLTKQDQNLVAVGTQVKGFLDSIDRESVEIPLPNIFYLDDKLRKQVWWILKKANLRTRKVMDWELDRVPVKDRQFVTKLLHNGGRIVTLPGATQEVRRK